MNTKIKAINFNLWQDVKTYAENKMKKLEIFLPISVTLTLKKDNGEEKLKIAELLVRIKDHEVFIEESSDTFEKAINTIIIKAKRQLKKLKEKSGQ